MEFLLDLPGLFLEHGDELLFAFEGGRQRLKGRDTNAWRWFLISVMVDFSA
jgi:hypothetical protein